MRDEAKREREIIYIVIFLSCGSQLYLYLASYVSFRSHFSQVPSCRPDLSGITHKVLLCKSVKKKNVVVFL